MNFVELEVNVPRTIGILRDALFFSEQSGRITGISRPVRC